MAMTQKGFESVARLADVHDQVPFGVTRANGERVCLIRRGHLITAVQDVCTHQEFAMSAGDILSDGTIQCAWHGARFDCATGEVRQVPATKPLPVYEVKVEDGQILIGGLRPRSRNGFEPCEAEVTA